MRQVDKVILLVCPFLSLSLVGGGGDNSKRVSLSISSVHKAVSSNFGKERKEYLLWPKFENCKKMNIHFVAVPPSFHLCR